MNDKYKSCCRVLWLFLTITCLFVFFGRTTTAKAAGSSEALVIQNIAKIDDGITNWQYKSSSLSPSNEIGQIPIGGNSYLAYTFGAARNSSNKVVAGDTTITKDSTISSGSIYNSKINIFINRNGYYYGILHQPEYSFIGSGGFPERTSDTSLDFAYLNSGSPSLNANYAILPKLQHKVFYTSKDANNNIVALKIGGYFYNLDLYAEILLRPSPTGAPIVQRELYLYNPENGTNKTKLQIFFGQDTSIDATGAPAVDDVPLYSMGNDTGLYLFSAKDPTTSDAKLYVTNDVADGFTAFMGKAYDKDRWHLKGKSNTGSTTVAGGDITKPNLGYEGSGKDGSGDIGTFAGANLLYGTDAAGNLYPVVDKNVKQDSAYTLRWDENVTITPGETLHYASNLGATLAGYAIPQVSKTYTNSTPHADGLNHVGDKLHFTLTVQNNGLNSRWYYTQIQDALPDGLTIDANSVKFKHTKMVTTGTGHDQVDKEEEVGAGIVDSDKINGNVLDFAPEANLSDKDKYYITFDATINYDAKGTLVNEAKFTGLNQVYNTGNKSYTADVEIPVVASTFQYSFKKFIRNVSTDTNSTFGKTASGKKGDIIEYQTKFASTGTDTMNGARFADTVPDGLEFDPDSVTIGGVKQTVTVNDNNPNHFEFDIGAKSNNSFVTVVFRAMVTSMQQKTVSNVATMNNVLTSANGTLNSIPTDNADLNIEETMETTSFIEVPTVLDFGSVNSANVERIIPGQRLEGRLRIMHSNDSAFDVSVSYDNDNDAIASNGQKLVNTDDPVIFLNQNSNANTDNWLPLSTTGTPIKKEGFNGPFDDYDLTKYISFDKWKLRVPSDAQTGAYSGKITWLISDTP